MLALEKGLDDKKLKLFLKESFIRMINEPEDDDGGAADEDRFNVPGVVNVSPQDKEAIERVTLEIFEKRCFIL
jgi:hypothetical protein